MPSERPAAAFSGEITVLLHRSAEGDREAFRRLIPLVYGDLRGLAHRRLRSERSGHTLNATDPTRLGDMGSGEHLSHPAYTPGSGSGPTFQSFPHAIGRTCGS